MGSGVNELGELTSVNAEYVCIVASIMFTS